MDSDSFFSKYDSLILDTIHRGHVPGVSIAVVHGDSTSTKGYGIARYPDEKVTPTTLYDACSMSKAFVAAGISLLIDQPPPSVEKGNIDWSTPVSRLLPDFVLSNSRSTELVTIEDILSHRSGCPDLDDACLGIHAKIPDTPKSVTRKLRHLPLTASVRERYQYCNVMYVVAAHLIETLTGQSLVDFLRQRIWEPLHMRNTYFGVDDIIEHGTIDRLAKGYGWDDDEKGYFEIPWPIQPEGAGAGEIHSTADDYARFLRCMIEKTGPISSTGHGELIKPRTITNYTPKPRISHDGASNGFACKMMFLPGRNWGVVIFGNATPAVDVHDKICWTMIDDLLSVPSEKRFNWDKQFAEDEKADQTRRSVEDLYPKIPKLPVTLSLPLASYAGRYETDGWGSLVVEHKGEKLVIDATDRSWRFTLSLTHVSGEFFAAEKFDIETRDRDMIRAAFRIGPEGEANLLGIDLVADLGDLIWFKRLP